MRSHSLPSPSYISHYQPQPSRLGLSRSAPRFSFSVPISASSRSSCSLQSFSSTSFSYGFKSSDSLNAVITQIHGSNILRNPSECRAFDQDFVDMPSLNDHEATAGYVLSSSDGEDSDSEFTLNPVSDIDLPSVSNNDALTMTTHRLAMIGRGRKRHRVRYGAFMNMVLVFFLTVLLLYVDWCAWRIVRLPLPSFHLSRPFIISAFLASCAGYIFVPLLYRLKIYQIIRKEGPVRHSLKRKTPTLGGLFFVPVGVTVAKYISCFSSSEITGVMAATIAFGAIGLLDDILGRIKDQNGGLSASARIFLEVAVGALFSFWLGGASISSPYGMYTFLH